MATIFKNNYDTEAQAITVTLASLANAAARQSTVVDNTSFLYLDVLVQLVLKSGASGVSANGFVNVYAFGTVDAATPTYGESAGASDAAITLVAPTNLRLIGTVNVVANATTYKSNPMSVAAAFGGVLPEKWGIVIENQSGASLDSTEGNHKKIYQGVWAQGV
jgi:hypothetical protein